MGADDSSRIRELYERAVADYGNALKRLARVYEMDAVRPLRFMPDIA